MDPQGIWLTLSFDYCVSRRRLTENRKELVDQLMESFRERLEAEIEEQMK